MVQKLLSGQKKQIWWNSSKVKKERKKEERKKERKKEKKEKKERKERKNTMVGWRKSKEGK